ncbi:MAG TPA: S9 family peptidase [Anaerolineae bacterium]|nr:S9 family peptidase [Anaerolineae bacterium]
MLPNQMLDALLHLPELRVPKISRDGRWIAWTWFRTGPAADVYCAPTDGSTAPIRLTETPDNTWLASWTPDSKAVLVAQDRGGDERYQLFRVDIANPGMHPLTEASPNYFLRGGQLHPNDRWLVYAANFDVASGEEIQPTLIYRHDLENGERVILARPEKPCYYVPRLNHAGTHILYTRKDRHPAGRQIWLVDIEGTEDREILNCGPSLKVYASWFPDSQRIVALAETETHRRLGVWNLSDEKLRWLIDDPERNLEGAFVPANGEHIAVVDVRQARRRASLVDPGTGEEMILPESPLNLTLQAPAEDGEWIALAYNSQQPEDLVRLPIEDPQPKSMVSLTKVWERTSLSPSDLTSAEDFRWLATDGLEVQGWLYRAAGEAKGTIVYVHGGPTHHSEDWINSQIQFFVARGLNVLDVNYRGSTGFGLSFQEAIKASGWGGQEQDDIRAGIEALIASGIASPGKVGITGTSFGGYSSWYAITHYPQELVAAAAPICGMTDLVVDYETTRPDLRPYSEEMMGGNPEEAPERFYERSPIHFVGDIQGRLLIVQGMQDPNVTPENVRVVRSELDQAGVPYEVLAFEDEGHGILRPKNLKVLYLRLVKFFESAFEGS